MRGSLTMRLVIFAVVLVAVGTAAVVFVPRWQRRAAIERALGRDFPPGMPLAAAVVHLRRLGLEFSIDSTAEGTSVVTWGRKVARHGGITTVTEQQIVFDAQARLREMRTVDEIRSP